MKKTITTIIFLAATIVLAISDPNTPIVPPRPGVESVSIVDAETLRITTSRDIKKTVLIRKVKRNLKEIERLRAENVVLRVKLAKFK